MPQHYVTLIVWNLIMEKKCILSEALPPWLPRGLANRPFDRVDNSSHDPPFRRSIFAQNIVSGRPIRPSPGREWLIAERVGRRRIGACGENRSENETSSGRHERGRLPGGRENVHAGRPSAATLREAAEGPGASAGLRDATGRCALLGRGATHHAARRIFAAGLQKGLSR